MTHEITSVKPGNVFIQKRNSHEWVIADSSKEIKSVRTDRGDAVTVIAIEKDSIVTLLIKGSIVLVGERIINDVFDKI